MRALQHLSHDHKCFFASIPSKSTLSCYDSEAKQNKKSQNTNQAVFPYAIFSPTSTNISFTDQLLQIIVKLICFIYFSFTPWSLKYSSCLPVKFQSKRLFQLYLHLSTVFVTIVENFFVLKHCTSLILVTKCIPGCVPVFLISHVSPLHVLLPVYL